MAEPQSRNESILQAIIDGTQYTDPPQSRIEDLLLQVKEVIEGGSGTTDYEDLENKPSINNVELFGDKSLSDLGVASEGAVAAKASQSDIAPTFSDATAYTVGDVVYYEGSLYRFTADHSAGAWDSTDVEIVTVDDLVDGLKPVDSVTDGDMRPVTSNAVYEYLNNSVTVTGDTNDTHATLLNKLYAAIDASRISRHSIILYENDCYRCSNRVTREFELLVPYFSSSQAYFDAVKITLSSTNSIKKYIRFRTNVGSGEYTSPTGAVTDVSNNSANNKTYTLYYR